MAAQSKQRGTTPGAPARAKRFIDYPRGAKTGVRRWIPSWRLIVGAIVTGFLLMIGMFAAAVAFTPVPEASELARSEKTIVYWNDGKSELGRLGEANRISIPFEDMPVTLRQAVLAAEDREFYEHGGFDPTAIVRAGWNDLRGGGTQGGSTITQQYAKNAYLTHEQTLVRKARELVLSVKLETEASKDEILGDYLNTIYMGRGAYGVETASQAYFGKPASELTLSESAVLAAVIRAPSGYDPDTNEEKLRARYQYVLDGMVQKGWITPAEAKAAKFPKFKSQKTAKNALAGTNGYLLESIRREMLRRGYTEEDLNVGGFRIVSTFDKVDQAAAVESVQNSGVSQEKGLRIGLTSVKTDTGEVIAMYGGADYLKNQLSNADQAVGLAGSTFKPFALAAAFEDDISLDSRWDGNSPRTIRGYKLQNESNVSYGNVSLLTAIEKSVNTVFVDLSDQIGHEKVKEAAIRAGVPAETVGLGTADPTTVLGTASPTTMDMAGAYATFANRGERVTPTTIKEISRGGSVEYVLSPDPQRAFSTETADEVNYALQKVVTSGTGFAASSIGRPAAGKTGTTDNNKSAWFVGYTPQIATAVMLVKQDKRGNAMTLYGTGGGGSVHGGDYPARIWANYMDVAMANLDVESFESTNENDYGSSNDYYRYPTPSNSPSQRPSKTPNQSPSSSPTSSRPTASPSSSAKPTATEEPAVP